MLSGVSIWQLLIILVIVVLLFGTKRLRSLGTDLGGALKSFRGALREGEDEQVSHERIATTDTEGTETQSEKDQNKV